MEEDIFSIEIYTDEKGNQPFIKWIEALNDIHARAKIKVRLARIRLGNLGDWKSLGEGLYEMRVNEGAGYQLYFTQELNKKIILLGGNKKTQSKDIQKARYYLKTIGVRHEKRH